MACTAPTAELAAPARYRSRRSLMSCPIRNRSAGLSSQTKTLMSPRGLSVSEAISPLSCNSSLPPQDAGLKGTTPASVRGRYDEHRTAGLVEHAVRRAAQELRTPGRASARPDDDQVGVPLVCHRDQGRGDPATAAHGERLGGEPGGPRCLGSLAGDPERLVLGRRIEFGRGRAERAEVRVEWTA